MAFLGDSGVEDSIGWLQLGHPSCSSDSNIRIDTSH